MRWLLSIVTAICLLGAAGARGDGRIGGPAGNDAAAQLARPAVLVAHAPARRIAHDHPVRLPVFTAVEVASVDAPVCAVVERTARVAVASPEERAPGVSSRGPPVASSQS